MTLIWRSTKKAGQEPDAVRTSGPRRFGYLVDDVEAAPEHNGDEITKEYARDVLGLFFQHGHLSDSDPRAIALAREHGRSPASVSKGADMTDPLDILTLDAWVTSDQHWEHPNIRRYQHRPADHFERMRRLWFELVQPDDVLLHLGDIVCFGDRERHPHWVDGLPGRKLLLRGNHDKHSNSWYEAAGFTVLGRKPKLWVAPDGRVICFSHEPDRPHDALQPMLGGWDINVHGHIHANDWYESTPMLDYRNVCVEVTDYAPVRLRDVLDGTAGQRRLA